MKPLRLLALTWLLLVAACEDTILPPAVESVAQVEVVAAEDTIIAGSSLQLAATVRGVSGTLLTGRTVAWTSSATEIVSVTGSGRVDAHLPGVATVSAASGGRSGTVTITVRPVQQPVALVTVEPAGAVVIDLEAAVQFTASTWDAAGSELADRPVTWASSDTLVATVSEVGLVTGVAAGQALVTATSEGRSASTVVTVRGEQYDSDLMFDIGYGLEPQIYRLDLNTPGANPLPVLINDVGWDVSPSPDGSRIAFTCIDDHGPAICVADRDGGNWAKLTGGGGHEDQPSWSPDGTRIAFRRWPQGATPGPFNETRIWVMKVDGTGQVNLTADQVGAWQESPTWSPQQSDGSFRIAYSNQTMAGGYLVGRINSIQDDGTDRQAVSSGAGNLDTEPAWSPDGTSIVFVRQGPTAHGDLWVVNASTRAERQLIGDELADAQGSPAWSPDGKRIAFSSKHELAEDGRWSFQIYSVLADGTGLVRHTDRGADKERPAWIMP